MSLLDKLPGFVKDIARPILRAGYPCYAVGGAVRGALLGLPASDYDVCGPATVEQVGRAVKDDPAIGVSRVYGKMGTMRLSVPGGYVEYTTFRRERYESGHRPAEVAFVGSAAEDALRRDFTCNALYLDIECGEVIDPTGGVSDIERRVLRATTADPSVILRDDGIRVLRMVRFAAQLRFSIDGRTFACADAELLRDIACERIQGELSLILLSDARYDLPGGKDALLSALGQLEELGVWDVVAPGCVMSPQACADVPPDLTLRLAALLRGNEPERAAQWLEAMRYPMNIVKEVAALLEDLDTGDTFSLLRRGYAHAEALAALNPALRPTLDRLRAQNAPDSLAALSIGGGDVADALGERSPRVGRAMEVLWRHAVEHPQDNTRDGLMNRLRQWMKEEST